MDPQSKKSKDWTLFGTAEDRAISTAKYKRGMGINPKAQIESNAEAAKRSRAMDNPTHRPYDKGTAPIGLKKPPKAASKFKNSVNDPVFKAHSLSGYVPYIVERKIKESKDKKPPKVAVAETPVAKSGFGPRISEQAKLERLRATRAALDKKPADAPKIPKPTPKPKVRPERLAAETVRRVEGPRAAVNKTGIAGAKRSFSGNWTGAAPARAPKSLAEATRRGLSDEYMKRNRPKGNILEVVKTKVSIGMTPKKAAPVGSNKSKLAAQFRAKMQGRAK